MSDYRVIVVPYDFSSHSAVALDAAVDLARRLGSDLQLVPVLQTPAYGYAYPVATGGGAPPPFDLVYLRERAQQALDEVAGAVKEGLSGKIDSRVVEGNLIANAVSDTAEELGADLIVMGTHGRSGLAHAFLGSVAERTLRRAPCPVLTVRATEDQEKEKAAQDEQ